MAKKDVNFVIGADVDSKDFDAFLKYLRANKNIIAESLNADPKDLTRLTSEIRAFKKEFDEVTKTSKTADGIVAVSPQVQARLEKYLVLLEKLKYFKEAMADAKDPQGVKLEVTGMNTVVSTLEKLREKASVAVVQKVIVEKVKEENLEKNPPKKVPGPYDQYKEDLGKYQATMAEAKAVMASYQNVLEAGGAGLDAQLASLKRLHDALTVEQGRLQKIWANSKGAVLKPSSVFNMPIAPTGPPLVEGYDAQVQAALAALDGAGTTGSTTRATNPLSGQEAAYRSILQQYRLDKAKAASGLPDAKSVTQLNQAYKDLILSYEKLIALGSVRIPLPSSPPRGAAPISYEKLGQLTGKIYSGEGAYNTNWTQTPKYIPKTVQYQSAADILEPGAAKKKADKAAAKAARDKAAEDEVNEAKKFKLRLPDLGGTVNQLQRMTSHATNINSLFHEMRNLMFALYGLQVFVQMVEGAGELERAMARINTLLNTTPTHLAEIKEQLKQQAADSGVNALELAKGLYNITSSGIKASEAQYALSIATKAAVAGVTDIDTAVKAGATSMLAFGKTTADLPEIYGAQFAMVDKGIGTYEDFAGVLGFVNANAATLGMTYQETYGALAYLTRQGFTASEAATRLGNAISAITAKDGKIKDALGIEAFTDEGKFKGFLNFLGEVNQSLANLNPEQRATKLQDVFSEKRTVQAVMAFTNNIKDAGSVIDAVAKSSSSTLEKAWQAGATGVHHSIDIIGAKWYNTVEEMKAAIATELSPAIMQILTDMDNINFKKVISDMKEVLTNSNGIKGSLSDLSTKSIFAPEVLQEIKKIIEAILVLRLALLGINMVVTKGPLLLAFSTLALIIGTMNSNLDLFGETLNNIKAAMPGIAKVFTVLLGILAKIPLLFDDAPMRTKEAEQNISTVNNAAARVQDFKSRTQGRAFTLEEKIEYDDLLNGKQGLNTMMTKASYKQGTPEHNQLLLLKNGLESSKTQFIGTAGNGPGLSKEPLLDKWHQKAFDDNNKALATTLQNAKGDYENLLDSLTSALEGKDNYKSPVAKNTLDGYNIIVDKLSKFGEDIGGDVAKSIKDYLNTTASTVPITAAAAGKKLPMLSEEYIKTNYQSGGYDTDESKIAQVYAKYSDVQNENTTVTMWGAYNDAVRAAGEKAKAFYEQNKEALDLEQTLSQQLEDTMKEFDSADLAWSTNQDIKAAPALTATRDNVVARIEGIKLAMTTVQDTEAQYKQLQNVAPSDFQAVLKMPENQSTGLDSLMDSVAKNADLSTRNTIYAMRATYDSLYANTVEIADTMAASTDLTAQGALDAAKQIDDNGAELFKISAEMRRVARSLGLPEYKSSSEYDQPRYVGRVAKMPSYYRNKQNVKDDNEEQQRQSDRTKQLSSQYKTLADSADNLLKVLASLDDRLMTVASMFSALNTGAGDWSKNKTDFEGVKALAAQTGRPVTGLESAAYVASQAAVVAQMAGAAIGAIQSYLDAESAKSEEKAKTVYDAQLTEYKRQTSILESLVSAFDSLADSLTNSVLDSSLGNPTQALAKLNSMYNIIGDRAVSTYASAKVKVTGQYALGVKNSRSYNSGVDLAELAGVGPTNSMTVEELRAFRDKVGTADFQAAATSKAAEDPRSTYYHNVSIKPGKMSTDVTIDWASVNAALTVQINLLEKYEATMENLRLTAKYSGLKSMSFTSAASQEQSIRESLREAGTSETGITDIITQMKDAGLIVDDFTVNVMNDFKNSAISAFASGASGADAMNDALAGLGSTLKSDMASELYKTLFGNATNSVEDGAKSIWIKYNEAKDNAAGNRKSFDATGTMASLLGTELDWTQIENIAAFGKNFDDLLTNIKQTALDKGLDQKTVDAMFGFTGAEQIIQTRIAAIKDAMANAMSSAIDTGNFQTFNEAMGQSVYDAIKSAVIAAFSEGEIYKQYVAKWGLTDATKAQLEAAKTPEEFMKIASGVFTGAVDALKGANMWGADNKGYGSNADLDNNTGSSYYTGTAAATTNITYKQFYFAPVIENLYGENQTQLFKEFKEWEAEEDAGQA